MGGTILICVPHPITLVFKVWPNFNSVKRYMAANIEPQQWEVAEPVAGRTIHRGRGGCYRKWAKIFDSLPKNIRM